MKNVVVIEAYEPHSVLPRASDCTSLVEAFKKEEHPLLDYVRLEVGKRVKLPKDGEEEETPSQGTLLFLSVLFRVTVLCTKLRSDLCVKGQKKLYTTWREGTEERLQRSCGGGEGDEN